MISEGNIIYFSPFYFKNGGTKNKYFIVLKVMQNSVVLASLPSSVNHLPNDIALQHGCIEIPEKCINCYIFESNKIIAKNGWSFQLTTYLYGQWLDDYEIDNLLSIYPVEKIDYEIMGELTDEEMQKVIECFKNSASVKRKYKKLFGSQYS